ncbi:MAG: hypothetical protein ACR2NI_11050, partial [Pirellulales bacterium]
RLQHERKKRARCDKGPRAQTETESTQDTRTESISHMGLHVFTVRPPTHQKCGAHWEARRANMRSVY